MKDGFEFSIDGITRHFWGQEVTDWMLPVFWGIARKYPNVRIGEIGFRGATSTMAWLLAAKDSLGKVWSMDIEPCLAGRELVAATGLGYIHTFMQGDSKELTFPEPLDVLFIDGDHTYSGVEADYERHAPKVKPGGVIFLHDTVSWESVGQFCLDRGIFTIPLGAGLGIKMC